ncbi:1-(5-phosphoribosyl)-5-[(5-phosphoribosylamino)methylideneamino]imidazole-4-carboxamide isomerase [Thermomonas sp.]|uniref:1-(5-phosphoribosyl)-5-[(5- phosphoribosylamino)methylideneamino]imidazole-4- carboxamide isomerase n=1 Tax=Thermomonas sp. TaxID=1971895 RepID=UPI002488F7F6|nr:1-(5-phosphoribosyl)-5-[(5-phosphoribosylamino)methylideneamino]imidazole-4-carboxamide isomerase [Thermomonas sp.]MDI1252955.1 1-(5-phosphoribosyl)-5-[(5-phosphoribosylamino)methylideneamino]imidazole-4-carboxamide isomerase [Thermomonas sp.]
MTAVLYPAIDVRDGRVVRLQQGDYARETRYADDPFELASRYAAQGATWLHLVDLDAARDGGYAQLDLLSRIKTATSMSVQTGGGIRDETGVDALFAAGADRVVVGSLAIREPERVKGWLARYGAERVTVALDASCNPDGEWQLPSHGWTRASGTSLFTLLDEYLHAGARHVLCTDIARDGMLAGPALELYGQLLARAPQVQLQASGGIRSVDDIRKATTLGCAGVVLGKALLDARFTVTEALDGVASC